MRIFKYGVYILLYLVLLFISGLLNIVVFNELDWSLILNQKFWLGMIIDYAVYLSLFVITAMFSFDILAEKDQEYVGLEKNIFDMKDILVSDDFTVDILNGNFWAKKGTWLETVKTYLGNIQRKKSHKVHTEILTLPEDKWSKKTKKYHKKEKELKRMITDEFINDELLHRYRYNLSLKTKFKKIKFKEITKNEVIYGTIMLPTEDSLLQRKPLLRRVTFKLTMVLPSIFFKVIYEILTIDRFVSQAELLKSLSFMIIMALSYVLAGVFSAKKAHMDRVSNATIRYGIALDYKNGKRNKVAPIHVNRMEIT